MKTLLIEYDSGVSIDRLISYGISMKDLLKSLEDANNRISNSLKIDRNVLSLKDGKIRASGVAGIVKLSSNIELEIMPKFFANDNGLEWRTTLYLLSALSKHGSILINERIQASSSYSSSLYDVAGRMLAEEYLKNQRKIIRKYKKEIFFDYCVDGEINFDSLFEADPNGIGQSKVSFDKVNEYNATINQAMKVVIPYVSDARTRNVLQSAVEVFGKQKYKKGPKLNVPVRNREWENAYNLSYDITQGLGAAYKSGGYFAPGFIANTWQMWEWLITTAVIINSPNRKVISQYNVKWGKKNCDGKEYMVNIFPDVAVYEKKDRNLPLFLVDAKYKLLKNDSTGEIERSDLYEAYAFCMSVNANKIFLAYPAQGEKVKEAGSVVKKSEYIINGISVYAILVTFGIISEKGGIFMFSQNLISGIENIINNK